MTSASMLMLESSPFQADSNLLAEMSGACADAAPANIIATRTVATRNVRAPRLSCGGERHRGHPQPERQHRDHPGVEETLESDALVDGGHLFDRHKQQRDAL